MYITSEAADKITVVRFGPDGTVVDREIPTGMMPTDIDGPHGLAVSPDKAYFYVSIAHGQPNGSLWKYSTKDDKLVGRVTLGMFPATLDITPDGEFLFVVNFNLHGEGCPRPCRSSGPKACRRSHAFRRVRCPMARGSVRKARSTTPCA